MSQIAATQSVSYLSPLRPVDTGATQEKLLEAIYQLKEMAEGNLCSDTIALMTGKVGLIQDYLFKLD